MGVLVCIHFHGRTLPDFIEKQDHAKLVFLSDQDPFHANQWPVNNSDSISDGKIRVRFDLPHRQGSTDSFNGS